ncbi:MAG: SDR family NAD(P)-dependent oxidoreductase, partial [Alphaproteobacteria bacterium]|nr:SDR family NAD(P)-dependent oxidoreductase [Alphaproteobacteria bacterium]
DVNLTGVFLTGREAAAHMAELGNGGVIIPISSVARHGNPGQMNYSAAKAGVAALAKLWAEELSRFRIRCAAIAPGFIATEMVLNVDLPATFLDWAGAERPAGYEGRSLSTLVEGKGSDKPWRTHFFCEHLDLPPTLTWEGIRDSRYVYARYFDQKPPFEFLHDLEQDRDELKNFASDPAHAEALKKMRELCDAEMNARGGPLPPIDQRGVQKGEGGAKKAKAKKKQPTQ